MRHGHIRHLVLGIAVTIFGLGWAAAQQTGLKLPDWSMNASVIEACSCPLFCPTYFGTRPAAHPEGLNGEAKYYCRFNSAFKVNSGSYGKIKLDGVLFWLAGDRGEDHARGKMDWAALVFEKSLSQEQREAVAAIVGFLYPIQFGSVALSEGEIAWNGGADEASALLDGGTTGEVRLVRFPGVVAGPVLLQNLRYWGAARNEGFNIMQSKTQAYRVGPRPFQAQDSTGFTITVDMSSKDPVPGPNPGAN